MSRIFADECINKDLVDALRAAGHEVSTVYEAGMSGSSDIEVFDYACKKNLVLLTFDRGFGDIFTYNILSGHGIVVELIGQMTKDEIINIILAFFAENRNLKGKLVIIGKTRIRIIQR